MLTVLSGAVPMRGADEEVLAPSTAWRMMAPLGLHETTGIDTLEYDYYRQAIPSLVSDAWTTTGNMGAEGQNALWFGRSPRNDFFFKDALAHWIPSWESMTFYNTRTPMTLLSFNTSGGRENAQERLKGTFSGNSGRRTQVGANLDYIYSKGSYANQATKDLIWGFSGSHMGDRFEFQGFYNHYNLLNKENGGITNDLYITDPAQLQGGVSSINAKSIPTRLTAAHTRYVGGQLVANSRYKVGYWHEETVNDTTVKRTYIPVSSFIWTLELDHGKHLFRNDAPGEASNFFEHTYLSPGITRDRTTSLSVSNTLGVSMLEGFHRYAKFGLAAYATYEWRRYSQTPDTMERVPGLDALPQGIERIAPRATENMLWVGGQLTKQRGSILTYAADVKFGITGPAAGDIDAHGRIDTRFALMGDTVRLGAHAAFSNEHAPYLMQHYLSNHFVWDRDLDKTRRYRIGGSLCWDRTGTRLEANVENIDKYIYWSRDCTPLQHQGSIQVFAASLSQRLHAGILHWDNTLHYQATGNKDIIPLPAFAVYSNLYLLFNVATLHVQLGLSCDYYTKYRAPLYQPATMTFAVGQDKEIGNYPFINAYANMKLGKARFYVLMSHLNQGWTGKNYFSMAGYPVNPRRFQMGVSVDFAN